MKKFLLATVALSIFGAAPALSCGMMQQAATSAAASGQTAQLSGMMCSAPAAAQAQPQMSQPGQQQAQASGGCTCCRSMAMMQPQSGQPGGSSMPNMGNMPGMGGTPEMQHGTPPAPQPSKP
jgi:hypothetical protein